MASLLTAVRDLDRLRQIAAVLARHGFGELVQQTGLSTLVAGKTSADSATTKISRAKRLRLAIEELGPCFVKLGQVLSTRPDVVPDDIIAELKHLQDDVPPVPWAELRPAIEGELGAPIEELFAELDETPLASASIGQVHRAKLREGEQLIEVVVKVQRPRIRSVIDRDIDLLYWLARAIERSIPEAAHYAPVRLVGEFDHAINAELDYSLEADNAERFAQNFADMPTVVFPKVYRQVSSRKVITLSFLDGKNVFEAVKAGASGETIARNAIEIVIKMVFEHGFFHADPHPGNILIVGPVEQPVIGLIDLGLVGRLSPRMRDRIIDLMVAVAREDHRAMVDAVYAVATPTKKVDRNAFEADVARLTDKYLGKRLGDIDFAGITADLASVSMKYGLEVPPDFLMMGKALMTVEGIGKQIYPELDLLEEAKPYFTELAWHRYSPEKISQDLIHLGTRLLTAASDMPTHLQEILGDLRQGRLRIETRDPALAIATDKLGRRVFSGMVVAAMVLSGGMLLAVDKNLPGGILLASAAAWTTLHSLGLAFRRRSRD